MREPVDGQRFFTGRLGGVEDDDGASSRPTTDGGTASRSA